MTPLDCCREALADVTAQVAATLPPTCGQALRTLLRAGDTWETSALTGDPAPTVRPGWNLALRLCLERPDDADGDCDTNGVMPTGWAERFLADCDQAALIGQVLAQCASGHLLLQQHAPRTFVAWATSRRLSPEQRERADFDWWSAYLTRQAAPRLAVLRGDQDRIGALLGGDDRADAPLPAATRYVEGDPAEPTVRGYYRQLGRAYVARFAYQHSYPAEAEIGGATIGRYTEIVALLIGWLYRERDRRAPDGEHAPTIWDERALIAALAAAIDADPMVIDHALQPLILDRANAAYHCALPGSAAPPLIRLDAGRVAWSARGLLGEPLLFLMRELRRRYAREYHNSAHLREETFRQDLYRLFDDRRFVRSARPVVLRRDGAPRTDLDALVFDRKTGTLGVFELKAQDPFARSVEERQRQRDSFLQAHRQVSATLEWAQRHGADDVLARFDARAARQIHVRKVYIFVLGRYLAHVADGPAPDRRAAWGSWPRVLQIVESGAIAPDQRNPLGALFTRLRDAAPPGAPHQAGTHAASRTIAVGDLRLRIFPSFAAMRAEEDHHKPSITVNDHAALPRGQPF